MIYYRIERIILYLLLHSRMLAQQMIYYRIERNFSDLVNLLDLAIQMIYYRIESSTPQPIHPRSTYS